jgi:hypothetical protein
MIKGEAVSLLKKSLRAGDNSLVQVHGLEDLQDNLAGSKG